jgi:cytochrome c oxidase subunit 2
LIAVFRRRQGEWKSDQPQPTDRRALAWAIIGGAAAPAVVLIVIMALSIPIQNVFATNESSAAGGLTIEVIGHQWWWEVVYPADDFESANELHIPVGRPITLKLTSADVIHSFWVPQLNPQLELIPGQTNTFIIQADQPGTYQGECTEYCGIQHAHMDFVVIAQSQADYAAWVSQQKKPAVDPVVGSIEKSGQQAFLGSSCVYCHTVQGTNASGKLGPDLTHLASRTAIGAGARPNTPANLAGWVANAQAIKPGNKMPPVNMDSDQLQAILAYLESLK